jgi:delta1-piperideine-2-carboxylate reductase
MRLSIDEARRLLDTIMQRHGHSASEAAVIADHLLDCELRGLRQGGLARAISICEQLARIAGARQPMRVEHETPLSARIDGGNQVGYLVGKRATELAMEKAGSTGLAMVGAHNTWYTGMLSYYAEMVVRAGLVCMIASNASAWVAPHGATQGRFGTNPICFGFPGSDAPVIWDIGTSIIIHADAMLARRLGKDIPPGVAYDSQGRLTTDPSAALGGALLAWGGAKGSGLGLAVQLLGIMAGSTTIPQELAGFGFLIVLMNPELLAPGEDYRAKVSEYADWVRTAQPVDPAVPVRVPFERSMQDRARRIEERFVEVPDVIHNRLSELSL